MSSVAARRNLGGWLSAEWYGRALGAYAAALACTRVLTVGLSLAGVATGRGLAVGVLILSGLAGALLYQRWRPVSQDVYQADHGDQADSASVGLVAIVLFVVIAAVYLLLWWIAVLSVDLTCDGNAYHLPPMSLW